MPQHQKQTGKPIKSNSRAPLVDNHSARDIHIFKPHFVFSLRLHAPHLYFSLLSLLDCSVIQLIKGPKIERQHRETCNAGGSSLSAAMHNLHKSSEKATSPKPSYTGKHSVTNPLAWGSLGVCGEQLGGMAGKT